MKPIPYIRYNDLKKPFYTLDETCSMFEMDRTELRANSEKYNIVPQRDEVGQAGFSTYDLRRLHNHIYVETHPRANSDDIWND